jgi:outer membrane protein OmpA-like peptidoglycan-associated protein
MFKIRSKTITASLIAISMALTGCQTIDPYTGEKKTSNAAKGAGIGALVCGLVGAIKSGKHARNAALGCGAIGAGIGAYMDSQEDELRRSLADSGVSVQRNGDSIKLIMPGNITFATNKSDIQADFHTVLDSVAKVLAGYDQTAVEVEGHTDSTGSLSHNLSLSESRAMQVANYLKSKGISGQRITSYGKGPMKPIASNQSSEGRAQNRRVEIRIKAIPS